MLRTVRSYCDAVVNGRTAEDAFRHGESEMEELREEFKNGDTGVDGIVGEAVDVILCMIDVIHLHKPDISDIEIMHIVIQKCEKWERKYGKAPNND